MSDTTRPLQIGQSASTVRTFTPHDVEEYISLTGDPDPRLRQVPPAVPNVLLGGLFSQLLGMELPGRGTNYLKQWLRFPDIARVGEEITATVEVVRIRPEKHLVNLRTVCTVGAGQIACEGEALVLVREVEGAIGS